MDKIVNDLLNYNDDEIDKFALEHASQFKKLSPIEGLIIRGHILVEQCVTNAIELVIPNKSEFKPEKFTFSQKVILGNMLGICDQFKIEIHALNKLRNQIAHTLKYDDKLVSSIIAGITNKKADVFNSNNSESQRLAVCISFICGALNVSHKGARIKLLLSILPSK